jgi:plastocyanin
MKNTAKILGTIALIALVGAGCAKNQPTATNTNSSKPIAGASRANIASGEMVVRITQTGEFAPTTAFVKAGTKVIFQNDTSKFQRVASYPDPKEPAPTSFASENDIAPNAKYETTFTQTGRWLYNNPLNPAFGGAVEVSE